MKDFARQNGGRLAFSDGGGFGHRASLGSLPCFGQDWGRRPTLFCAIGLRQRYVTTAAVLHTCCACTDGLTMGYLVLLQGGQLIGIPTLR